ncbi:hypothetical protein GX563_08475 [Candidatus Bathyarchaeota archaeon]|nr:hypothetical protein [Candidatus Bathyarchaeota archaeon]
MTWGTQNATQAPKIQTTAPKGEEKTDKNRRVKPIQIQTNNNQPSELLDQLTKIKFTHAFVVRGTYAAFSKLEKTLETEFPDLFVVYKANSAGKLFISHSEAKTEEL